MTLHRTAVAAAMEALALALTACGSSTSSAEKSGATTSTTTTAGGRDAIVNTWRGTPTT